ncbi:MAG: type secretion C-terminal target protein, partial [Phycisphaerales bacterium]|nr:type secretion C-terminal target protein [Phycisphaerales bacterium]
GPLADNGGPTRTLALLAGSPAIDAGNNLLVPAGTTTDQRGPGFARVVNGTVDIGAFEVQPPPGVTVSPTSGLVTTEGGGTAAFAVVLTARPAANVTIPLASNNTAEGGTAVSSVTFTPANWNVPQTVTVYGADDAVRDGDVAYTIVTGDPTSADAAFDALTAAAVADVAVTNADDDPVPTLSVDSVSDPEGDAGTTPFTFTVTLSGRTADRVTVNYATAGGSAAAGSDFTAAGGTLVFPAGGPLTQTVTVPVTGDRVAEPDEIFTLGLTGATNATVPAVGSTGTGTIVNDDTPGVAVSPTNGLTTTEAGGTAAFTVVLASQPTAAVTVPLSSSNPAEGNAGAASVTFTPADWNTPQTVTVTGADDADDDGDVAYTIVTGDPASADPAYDALAAADVADVSVTNLDDDATPPAVSVGDVSAAEGDGGFTTFSFAVTRAGDATGLSTVDWSTADRVGPAAGVAQAGLDYVAASGSVAFGPGELTKTVTVSVVGDRNIEADQAFAVNLSNPTNLTVADGQGVGTILNDDQPPPYLSVADAAVTEGGAGTTRSVLFTVTLDRRINRPVTFRYATQAGTATGGTDFAAASGTATIPAFGTTAKVYVTVKGDAAVENDETYRLVLSSPTNAAFARSTAVGTILNDDKPPAPRVSVNGVTKKEGTAGQTTAFTFTVTLDRPAPGPVTVKYATKNGTATAGSDYAAASGTLTFAAGQTSKTVTVQVRGDTVDEADETFFVDLSAPTGGAALAVSRGVGKILDD